MRVALVHDWLTGMRGGEKVLLSLCRLFPEAPIHTLLYVRGSVGTELGSRAIHTSFVQHLPAAARHYRRYLPLFPAAVARLRLPQVDLVLSSSHCVAKGVRVPRGALHVCYCHTPMRYIWDRYNDYFAPERLGWPARRLIPMIARRLRAWDVATAAGVHRFVANSGYVAERIRRYYGREASVIAPPVDVDFFTPAEAEQPGTYDLIVSALVPYKRIGLALDAYRGTGRPLRIVGSGPDEAALRRLAPPEVQFLGRVDDERLRELYRGCRAVLLTGVEDFGIVPIEGLACGRPAVVFAEGGAPEAITPGVTGLLFGEATVASLRAALDALATLRFNTATLRATAEAFSRQVFEARIRGFVEEAMAHHLETISAC